MNEIVSLEIISLISCWASAICWSRRSIWYGRGWPTPKGRQSNSNPLQTNQWKENKETSPKGRKSEAIIYFHIFGSFAILFFPWKMSLSITRESGKTCKSSEVCDTGESGASPPPPTHPAPPLPSSPRPLIVARVTPFTFSHQWSFQCLSPLFRAGHTSTVNANDYLVSKTTFTAVC